MRSLAPDAPIHSSRQPDACRKGNITHCTKRSGVGMCPSHANLEKKENCSTMKNSARRYPQPRHDNCESLWKNRRKKCFHNSMGKGRNKIRLEDELLVKSPEYWLKL